MSTNKTLALPLAALFAIALLSSLASAAMSVSVTQSGADTDEVMKARTFIVEASGWTGDCAQATISFSGCSGCSLSGENTQKAIGGGASSISWTTVSASQLAAAQTISVSVSSGCTLQESSSSSFDIVLPPSLSLDATTSDSTVAKGGEPFSVNVEVSNDGETTASDISIDSATSGFTASCPAISSIDEGQSAAQSCSVTAASSLVGGSKTVTIEVSSTNADSVSDTVSITVDSKSGDGICDPGESATSDCDGGGDGNGGTPGGSGLGPAPSNVTKRPTLVPGVGLRNNTKLQAAIEKVLAKGKMSEQARQNMLRLSASITAQLSTTRMFSTAAGKSRITTTIKYTGREKAKNFMLFETVPKAFAGNASLVTVTAPGAAVEVVEDDPSWVIIYPEISSGEEISVTYEVSGIKSSSVIDAMAAEVYAESLEEPAALTTPDQVCTPASKRCSGSNLQQCSADGSEWETTESCVYGCDSSALKCGDEAEVTGGLPGELPWPLIAGVVVVAALAVVAALVYMKKSRKPGATASAIESVKQDLGQ
ncbi:MAG: hypothetical protein JXC85_00320 [Candidatus Aenigmarchaeota archaeon]|nr:hypothetical protein [Candidatus Aenigmarchaeota archaeon]